ncbi:MAG: PD-(D/E)XK nuclease domain-containing protein [Prevotella sp.]|nr:PD-(D/E)XK nuclease domain-containing protein [Bacteroidales bacterium]MDY4228747.1 PD-(D/E)XK nuclease domain-containing protein [Prevotella sp.]
MELKLDKSADEALAQVDDRAYALPWRHDGRKVFKVGVSFSTKERTVVEWKYVEE